MDAVSDPAVRDTAVCCPGIEACRTEVNFVTGIRNEKPKLSSQVKVKVKLRVKVKLSLGFN
jgi:hypothetical protein